MGFLGIYGISRDFLECPECPSINSSIEVLSQNFPKFQNFSKNCHKTSLFREKSLKILVTVANCNGSEHT